MVGYISGSVALRGIGAAACFAPFPKVFSDVNGLETFASVFTLRWRAANGKEISEVLTPEIYSRLAGPYVRRNAYGAALSYAPRLPDSLWQAVFRYGLTEPGALRREFGLPGEATDIRVEIRTKTRGRTDSWTLRAPSGK
jgi:hypothetical protein